MPLSIETLAELVAHPDTLPPELRDRRFLVFHGLDPSFVREEIARDAPLRKAGKKRYGFRLVGEATDLVGALRVLWEAIEGLGALAEQTFPPGTWQENLTQWLAQPHFSVPKDEEACVASSIISGAKAKHLESRFVIAVLGDAPYEGEGACVLEVPPASKPAKKDALLIKACKAGDVVRAKEWLAAGADPKAADERGDTALHYAVARRDRALVALLLDAGADPDAAARFSHAPAFAGFDARGRLGPVSTHLEDDDHFAVLRLLVERGADPEVRGPASDTLADLAAAAVPFREPWVRFFIERGATSRFLRPRWAHRRPMDALLASIHFLSARELAQVPNRLRLLAWLGCDPNGRPHGVQPTPLEEWLTMGYGAHEVEPAAIVAIAQAFADVGARDEVGRDGRRPSDRADMWAKHDARMSHYAEVARILRGVSAAGNAG
ncbi:Ankyrin protein [Minicystis rosea]|nr:Ankyrin protein [Minicystis rosea]